VLACPHHACAAECKNKQFKFYSNRSQLNLSQILRETDDDFEAGFAGSVFMRLGLERLKRNARACFNNVRSAAGETGGASSALQRNCAAVPAAAKQTDDFD
jgi:epoxyqueuosine reductase QueG